jgi:hypothetical protein
LLNNFVLVNALWRDAVKQPHKGPFFDGFLQILKIPLDFQAGKIFVLRFALFNTFISFFTRYQLKAFCCFNCRKRELAYERKSKSISE